MNHIKIQAITVSDPAQFGSAAIKNYTPKEVLINVLKQLGLFWPIAAVCVLIPGLHFILVPLFLILGVVKAVKASKIKFILLSGKVPCPSCKKDLTLENVSFLDFHSAICQNCVAVAKISLAG